MLDLTSLFEARHRGQLIGIALVLLATILGVWMATLRARRRMGRALGRKVTNAELNSLSAWIQATEAERHYPADRPPGQI